MPDDLIAHRKVPLGEPMTAEELDRLTHFTAGDLEAAKQRWRQNAPRGFRDLLDAQRDDGKED